MPHETVPQLVLLILLTVAFGGIALYLVMRVRKVGEGSQAVLEKIQSSFDRVQQLVQQSQHEFERSHELKSSTLRSEIQQSLQESRKELSQGIQQTQVALDTRVQSMDARLEQRLESMSQNVQTKLEANLKEGFVHFVKVQEQLQQTHTQLHELSNVGQSIHELNNLLKLPHLRGGFGEATLERMLSDLLIVSEYELQYRIVPTSTERVDAVIKLPDAVLPIDSKFPREQVLPLFESSDPAQLESARKTLLDVIRTMARSIREKYIHPEHGTTEMALLFVPSETLYFEILKSPKLCEELAKFKVFAVSPNTLAVTLQAVSTARKYYEMARGVQSTLEEVRKARQHYDRFEKRFTEVGTALNKAQEAFHTAGNHMSRYSGAVTRLVGEGSESHEALTSSTPSPTLPTL
jgi:DNA recombination protein RmuC